MGSWVDSWHELSSLGSCYPGFVTQGGAPAAGEVPVFVFHTIEPDRFAAQLRHLVENGYRTIDPEEYLRIMSGEVRARGGEVLLTIDDARSSLWRYGWPLLRRFGCRATTFVITGWTAGMGRRANLDDVEAGRVGAAQLAAIDPADAQVCTWEELREMHASGHVAVESHTHLHQRLFCDHSLTGLVQPDSIGTAADAVFSPYLGVTDSPYRKPASDFLGYPLARTVPLMACQPSLRIDAGFAQGFAEAFRRAAADCPPARCRSLAKELIAARGSTVPTAALQRLDRAAVVALIREDLAASQALLRRELRLPDAGQHLCLPFTIGSAQAVSVARELGFRSILWGVSPQRRVNAAGSDPLATVRLKNDFIWRLPGSGRRALTALYLEKFTRRMAGISPY